MKGVRFFEAVATVMVAWVLWITLMYLAYVAAPIWQAVLDGVDQLAPNATAFCAEDDPCWDCNSMGNMVCGPEGN